MELGESKLRVIVHALNVAADTFENDAKALTEAGGQYATLAPTFEMQARQSRELADEITERIG